MVPENWDDDATLEYNPFDPTTEWAVETVRKLAQTDYGIPANLLVVSDQVTNAVALLGETNASRIYSDEWLRLALLFKR